MEYLNLARRTIIPAKQCSSFVTLDCFLMPLFLIFNIIIIRSIFHSHSTSTQNTSTKENETLLAVGTAYVQGEDVAARGRILLFSVVKNPENSQILVCFFDSSLFANKSFCFMFN